MNYKQAEAMLHELKTIRKLLVMQSQTVFYCEHCKQLKANEQIKDFDKMRCPTCNHEVII